MSARLIDVADWIIKNRKGYAFKDYSLNQIMGELKYCAERMSMLCVTEDENVAGVVTGRLDKDKRVYFVFNILATRSKVVKQMMKFFNENYPQYSIKGIKHGNQQRLFTDTIKLEQKL